jgi:alcohol dehydrogenase
LLLLASPRIVLRALGFAGLSVVGLDAWPARQSALTSYRQDNVQTLQLPHFEFAFPTRIVFGPGSVGQLGNLVKEYGGQRVLLVTDPGIIGAGHAQRAVTSLETAGLMVAQFDGVIENPTTATVDQCVAAARDAKIDFLVGLGGGSSIDTARGANFLLTGGGRMQDYWGVNKATKPMLPLIAVPTTAGTGSECQSFALISQEDTHVKMACGDHKAAAKVALLDPELTLTQPTSVAATTGVDCLAHAIESAVTTRRTPMSQMLSFEAFRLGREGIEGWLANPDDLSARGQALLGAALAGMAIENSMLGAAHAGANPLTTHHGVPHGQAVGIMLPTVVRYNSEVPEARTIYQRLIAHAGMSADDGTSSEAAERLACYLEDLLRLACLAQTLEGLKIRGADLELLATEAAAQWTAQFNPRPIDTDGFLRMYRSAATA